MKNQLLVFVLLAFVVSCTNKADKSSEQTVQRPNIILIMADDLGYETINANGGTSYHTPELDKLAANGMRFEHCYAQPLCTPSRVKIMTGIYNVRNYLRFGILDTSQTTFGHLFQKAGYSTCIIGKWQLGKDSASPQKAGFDEHCLWQVQKGRTDTTGRDTRFSRPVLETNGRLKTYANDDFGPEVVSNYGLDFMERSVENEKPFLLYYPMILTHCPFSPTPDSEEWLKDTSAIMQYKGTAGYFKDMMTYTDQIIGKLNSKLEDLGIQNNTLIIFTGDNGTDTPIVSMWNDREVAGAKGKSTDAGTRVPLIVQWPNVVQEGSICKDLVDFSDFLPTICEAANISLPQNPGLDGISFLPQLKGEKGQSRKWVYNWYSRSGDAEKARVFARNHQYKLYATGEFYDIPQDPLEENALVTENLGPESKIVHQMLEEVLYSYQNRRLDAVKN